MLGLSDKDARTLAERLGGSRVAEELAELQHRVEGLAIDWLPLRDDSPYVDRTIGEARIRSRTGVSMRATTSSSRRQRLLHREEPTAHSRRETPRFCKEKEKEASMIPGRLTGRLVLGGCLGGLADVSLVGGLVMSAAAPSSFRTTEVLMRRLLVGTGSLQLGRQLLDRCLRRRGDDRQRHRPFPERRRHRRKGRWLAGADDRARRVHPHRRVGHRPGRRWIFRFDYVGKHQEEVEVSRRDLERDGWRISAPESFEQRLRELGVPPRP
jgi:hypothetical protein